MPWVRRGFALLGAGWDAERAGGSVSSQHHSEILHKKAGYGVTPSTKPPVKLPAKAFNVLRYIHISNTEAKTSATHSQSPGPTRSPSRGTLQICTLLNHPSSRLDVCPEFTASTQRKTSLRGGLASPTASGPSPSRPASISPHRQKRRHK